MLASEANMIPRIAFFDLDGTILNFGRTDVSEPVKQTLHSLQQHGCLVYLATGRAPFMIPSFAGVCFDGMLCFNGGLCYCGKEQIYSNPIDLGDMQTVIDNCKRIGVPVMLARPDRIISYFYNQDLEDYTKIAGLSSNVADAQTYDSVLRSGIYQLMVPVHAELDEAIVAGTLRVKTARWWDRATDVIPIDCGKAHGIKKVIDHLCIARESVIAFGDGGNDADMLEFVGLGIAMGNASDATKAAADYVTDSCEDDGVCTAVSKLFNI